MKINKKIILVISIVLLLVLAGCEGGKIFGKKQDKRPITDADIRKGTDGLDMEFLTNAPPERVFEDGRFPISLRLKNEGATDIIDDNKVKLVLGFETSYVNMDIEGKTCTEDEVEECDDGSEVVTGLCNEDVFLEKTGDVCTDWIDTGCTEDRVEECDDGSEVVTGLCNEDVFLEDVFLEKTGDVCTDWIGTECTEDRVEECDDGTDVVTGLCKDILKATGELCRIEIKGKSIYSPVGDEEFIQVNPQAKKISAQSETHPSTIFATACYPYNTTLGTSVCIDTDIIDEVKGKKACNVKDLTFSEGQGAPVAITKIETRMLPYADVNKVKPHFIIFIENKGNGEVVNSSKLNLSCSSSGLNYTDFNTITITASLPQGDLKCSENVDTGPTAVRLREKEDIVRCTLEDGVDIGRDAYTAPLKIELNYGYTFTISKDIIIEKVLKY